jgi:predicted exporter
MKQVDKSPDKLSDRLQDGAMLGGSVGCILSAIWAAIAPTIFIIYGIIDQTIRGYPPIWEKAIESIGPLMAIICTGGLMLGILPSAVIGLITGTGISWILFIKRDAISYKDAIIVGSLTSIAMSAIIHLLAWPLIEANNEGMLPRSLLYLLTLGIPSGIFVVAGGWAGGRLYTAIAQDKEHSG